MSDIRLSARPRTKGGSHHLRREGLIPAVIYGRRRESQALSVDGREFGQILGQGINTLIKLQIDGSEDSVMIKHLQRHPLRGNVVHIDFLAVALDELLKVTVPLVITGDEAVAESGGILQHQLREVEVECLPGDVPGSIHIDVSGLSVGDQVTAGDLAIPAGVKLLTGKDELAVSVTAPRMAETEEQDDDEEAADEPSTAEEPAEEPK